MEDERFERAWRAHGPAVLRYCTFSTGSPDIGEEIAAETFARFLARGDQVPVERTEAWLIRVARNLCVSHHRQMRRREALQARIRSTFTETVDDWTGSDVWECARRLSEPSRLVLFLRIAEDRPFAEIARMTGRSESATKMTFYRALEHMRRQMPSDDAELAPGPGGGADSVPAD